MKHTLIALFLATATFLAYASVDTSKKTILGVSEAGIFFLVEGQKWPWVCRPQGNGMVGCRTQGINYNCTWKPEPVYFTDCAATESDVWARKILTQTDVVASKNLTGE